MKVLEYPSGGKGPGTVPAGYKGDTKIAFLLEGAFAPFRGQGDTRLCVWLLTNSFLLL